MPASTTACSTATTRSCFSATPRRWSRASSRLCRLHTPPPTWGGAGGGGIDLLEDPPPGLASLDHPPHDGGGEKRMAVQFYRGGAAGRVAGFGATPLSRWARLRASLRARRIASAFSRARFSDGFS